MRRVQMWGVLMVLVVTGLHAAPAVAQEAQGTGAITGVVTDAETGSPIPGASVQVEGSDLGALTNQDGRFMLRGLEAGRYVLVVRYPGREDVRRTGVAVVGGGQATVQVALSALPMTMERVVVSATKTPVEMRDVPAAVEVVTSTSIARAGAKDFTDALQSVAGMSESSASETFQSIQLRGMPKLGNENELVLLLIDGVPQTDSRNSARLTALPIDNIDRVEVTKGPNSALYGRTAVGGVINIITKTAAPEPALNARLSTGGFGLLRLEAAASGPTNAGNGSYFVSWSDEQRESFHNQPTERRNNSIYGKLNQQLGDATSMFVTLNYATSHGGTPAPVPAYDGRPLWEIDPSFDRYTNLNLSTAEYNQDELRATLQAEHEFSDAFRLRNTFGYRSTAYIFREDGDVFARPTEGSSTITLWPFSLDQEEDHFYEELQLIAEVGPESFAHRMVAGVSWERNDGTAAGQLIFTDPATYGMPIDYNDPVPPARSDWIWEAYGGDEYSGNFFGFYLQDEISLFDDRLHATIGARYDVNELYTLRPNGDEVEASFKDFSPKAGVSYRVLEGEEPGSAQVSIYAQYGRAYRPPRTPRGLRQSVNPELVSEEIDNIEGGVKAGVLGGRVNLQAAVFSMSRKGMPIFVQDGPFSVEVSAGEQVFSGVEFAADARLTQALTLSGNVAAYDAEYGDYAFVDGGTEYDLEGNEVETSPRYQFDLAAGYYHPTGITLDVQTHYESERYLNRENTALADGYLITNARVGWQWRNVHAAVSLRNLLDSQYVSYGGLGSVFPGTPRHVLFDVGVQF